MYCISNYRIRIIFLLCFLCACTVSLIVAIGYFVQRRSDEVVVLDNPSISLIQCGVDSRDKSECDESEKNPVSKSEATVKSHISTAKESLTTAGDDSSQTSIDEWEQVNLRGRIVDGAMRAVSDARVTIIGVANGVNSNLAPPIDIPTDTDGVFHCSLRIPGKKWVVDRKLSGIVFRAVGGKNDELTSVLFLSWREIFNCPEVLLQLPLEKSYFLKGKIYIDGLPLINSSIRALTVEGIKALSPSGEVCEIRDDAIFCFSELNPKSRVIILLETGHPKNWFPLLHEIEVKSQRSNDLQVLLRSTRCIGRIEQVPSSTNPVQIDIVSNAYRNTKLAFPVSQNCMGNFEICFFARGSYKITASANGYASNSKIITINDDGGFQNFGTLFLEIGATVEGRLSPTYRRGSIHLSELKVFLVDQKGGIRNTEIDDSFKFQFLHVPDGTYKLIVTFRQFTSWTKSIVVNNGTTELINFSIDLGG